MVTRYVSVALASLSLLTVAFWAAFANRDVLKVLFAWPIGLSVDLGNLVAIVIALVALGMTYYGIRTEIRRAQEEGRIAREIARETNAKQAYAEFLKVAFDNPEMAIGVYDGSKLHEVQRYDTFVSIMLTSFDEVLAYDKSASRDEWYAPMRWSMHFHMPYLKTIFDKNLPPSENYRGAYSAAVLALYDELAGERAFPA